jgi:hypothetical protein
VPREGAAGWVKQKGENYEKTFISNNGGFCNGKSACRQNMRNEQYV